jgi:excisionase family DNA binding protein
MRFFNVKEVANQLGVSLGTIYGAVDRGELRAHRFGRRTALRISEERLREYIDRCAEMQVAPPQPPRTFRHLKL